MKEQSNNQLIPNQVIKEQPFHEEKWIGIKLQDYTLNDKVVHHCETVYRPTTKKGGISGVNIIPIIKYKQKSPQIVLIANFRPACNCFVLQFPAGMIEDNNYVANVKRELQQETGLIIDKMIEIPLLINYCDPWKSDESGIMFLGIVNGDDPNSMKEQHLEQEQNIRVYRLELNDKIGENLRKLAQQNQYIIESEVSFLITGYLFESMFINS